MRNRTRRAFRGWCAWPAAALLGLAVALAATACGDNPPPTRPTPAPQPTPTAATVTAGRVVQSPTGIGLVLATSFTFTADGFRASDGSALTYTWDFGDGGRQTGAASVTHLYSGTGAFTVSVTAATAAGTSATASLGDVAATTVDGRWGLQDATGAFVVRNTSLTQNLTAVGGDDTGLNCRFAVSGSVMPQRGISLTWTRARNDCQGRSLPEVITFTGVVDESAGGFLGTLDTGAPARLVACSRPSCA